MDTSGFYKLGSDGIAYAQIFVSGPGYMLHREDAEDSPSKVEEINGWKWFLNDTDAYAYFQPTTVTISPLQGKIALEDAGLLDDIEAYMLTADKKTKLAWEYALEFRRDSPLLLNLAGLLGLTEEQLDELFALAKTIEV